MSKVVFSNVNYIGNAGDYWSSPLHYYDFSSIDHERINFLDDRIQKIKGKIVIIGGGGLITTKENYLNGILKNILIGNKVIFWGVGSNTACNPYFDILSHPNVILVGLRDIVHNINYNYIPCVSSKNKIFDLDFNISNEIGIIEHVDYSIKIDGIPKIKNSESIENLINFIGTKSILISSTFHGVFWSQLLGKKVLYYNDDGDLNSKFFYLKNRVTVCDNFNYKEKIKNLTNLDGFLQECRGINDLFYFDVMNIIKKYS